MRACVQRVSEANVVVDGEITGSIERGVLVLLGVTASDTPDDLSWLAEKIIQLRIFPDDQEKMNCSLLEIGGAMLVVSQFTLYADCRKGRRPSFVAAAPPEQAERMYDQFVNYVAGQGIATATGQFRAAMQVRLTGDGPVTMWIDSAERGGS
ncbi:MAG: D-aminoacyl-tRNA deacylase [Pirellulales bacterium]|nr:D-aminoacyl-tRNA deacylase [Pirellulales bacterium]